MTDADMLSLLSLALLSLRCALSAGSKCVFPLKQVMQFTSFTDNLPALTPYFKAGPVVCRTAESLSHKCFHVVCTKVTPAATS